MGTLRLTAVMVHSSQGYQMQVGNRVTVGEIARYLTQYETYIEASTLEVARLVHNPQRLQDMDIQAGDRLLIFTQPPKYADLPATLRPGDKIVKFALGDFQVNSRGKRSLLVGKPDEAQQIIPDIDLRYFVAPEALEFVSRNSMWLNFDESGQVWYATKAGQTRILIDEFELGVNPMPLNVGQRVRFYRATDEPQRNLPIGDVQLTVEEWMQSRSTTAHIEAGEVGVNLRVGLEREGQSLRASGNLRMGQLVTSLTQYNGAELSPDVHLYHLRLVAPDVRIQHLHLSQDEFLYTALNMHYARNVLLIRDIHNRERTFTLSAGREDVTKVIGCRRHTDVNDLSIDVDLHDALTGHGYEPQLFNGVTPYLGRISYKAAENTWWIWLEDRASVPLFVNNQRVTSSAAIPLIGGDVLSFGPNVSQYYLRFEVEIRF
jgi:hypothetical protein